MNEFSRRVLMTVSGVVICAFSVGLFSFSCFGVDPFQVFAHGTWNLTWLNYGTYYVILNAVILVVIFFLDKKKLGLGTLINLFLVGYIVEFSEWVMNTLFPDPSILLRVIALLLGIVIMCLSSALYFTADLGVSTYDAVALILSERTPVPFRFCRIGCDLICVGVGWFLGGAVGIGTVVTAFFMGPLITFFNNTVAIPMRYGKNCGPDGKTAAGSKN